MNEHKLFLVPCFSLHSIDRNLTASPTIKTQIPTTNCTQKYTKWFPTFQSNKQNRWLLLFSLHVVKIYLPNAKCKRFMRTFLDIYRNHRMIYCHAFLKSWRFPNIENHDTKHKTVGCRRFMWFIIRLFIRNLVTAEVFSSDLSFWCLGELHNFPGFGNTMTNTSTYILWKNDSLKIGAKGKFTISFHVYVFPLQIRHLQMQIFDLISFICSSTEFVRHLYLAMEFMIDSSHLNCEYDSNDT